LLSVWTNEQGYPNVNFEKLLLATDFIPDIVAKLHRQSLTESSQTLKVIDFMPIVGWFESIIEFKYPRLIHTLNIANSVDNAKYVLEER